MKVSDVLAQRGIMGPDETSRRKWAKRYLRARWPAGLGRHHHIEFRARWLPLVRQELGQRDGLRCAACSTEPTPAELQDGGWPVWLEVDHIVPLEHDGDHHIDNMRLLCKRCNRDAWIAARIAQ